MITVRFVYSTGITREIFRNVRLVGSWDTAGKFSDAWTAAPASMMLQRLDDGCPSYVAEIQFDQVGVGREFRWGVRLDIPHGPNIWGIPTEILDAQSTERHRSFILSAEGGEQRYFLTQCRRFGAQKRFSAQGAKPTIEFSTWAPNARKVELVVGSYDKTLAEKNTGYIADDGMGIDTVFCQHGVFSMLRDNEGIWHSDLPMEVSDFAFWDHRPYMFHITEDDGTVAYRTDLYSRCQIGKGRTTPSAGVHYDGSYEDLDGTKSCSVVIDPDTVTRDFEEPAWPETHFLDQTEFWKNEFDQSRPVPRNLEELVIYELHVGSLGFEHPDEAGTFGDVLKFLDYLVDLGVNAVELLPVLEFEGVDQWGYGTSHPFALEFSAGGRDQLKHVIRACHQRGIAVILDVVYNHYHADADRAEWAYDTNSPEKNIYYWYEGASTDYPDPQGGYLDNGSTGWAPRFYEEMIRNWLISSAVALLEEFHVDGFRVDLPQAIYRFNVRHADGRPVAAANAFGAKFLREWTRTMKMFKPECFLIAEDHSDQAIVTQSTERSGLGFDATWYSTFYHHLIGDGNYGANYARILRIAGFGGNSQIAMDYFAGALDWSGHHKVVYHKDHDDVGNAAGTARNMVIAVNGAALTAAVRPWAEARCRTITGLTLLSAGTPMFFMFEELASVNPMMYKGFRDTRDDYLSLRAGAGAAMFKFYQDLISLRRHRGALKSRMIETIYVHNDNSVIAFLRTDGVDRLLVVASMNNQSFDQGYWLPCDQIGNGWWEEVFNSDAAVYGGRNVGNGGQVISSTDAGISLVIPACGFVVLHSV